MKHNDFWVYKIKYKELGRLNGRYILLYDHESRYWPVSVGSSILVFSKRKTKKLAINIIEKDVLDIDLSFQLLYSKSIDTNACILNIINIFDDIIRYLNLDTTHIDMDLIDSVANYLTFDKDLAGIEDYDRFVVNYIQFITLVTRKVI